MEVKYYFDFFCDEPYRVVRPENTPWMAYLWNYLFDTPKEMLQHYEKLEEYEICSKIIKGMNIETGDKITMLSERLKCLAILEFNSLKGIERWNQTESKYIEKYMNRFIGKVMGNPEIITILDAHISEQLKNNK